MTNENAAPILRHKHYAAPSAFTPDSILREARRQKGLTKSDAPAVCVLDPDGDIVRYLKRAGRASGDEAWARNHLDLQLRGLLQAVCS